MHTRVLMLLSAAVMAAAGLVLTFCPSEVTCHYINRAPAGLILVVQAAGGLYLGFAMLNWMARENLIGGIYGRPVAMGNFLHFFVMAAALDRAVFANGRTSFIIVAAVVYSVFALWFGLVLFGDPLARRHTTKL